MLLIDSWCQETYVSSISMHYFDIIRNPIIGAKKFPRSEKGLAKNYISIALTVSKMVLIDS